MNTHLDWLQKVTVETTQESVGAIAAGKYFVLSLLYSELQIFIYKLNEDFVLISVDEMN